MTDLLKLTDEQFIQSMESVLHDATEITQDVEYRMGWLLIKAAAESPERYPLVETAIRRRLGIQ